MSRATFPGCHGPIWQHVPAAPSIRPQRLEVPLVRIPEHHRLAGDPAVHQRKEHVQARPGLRVAQDLGDGPLVELEQVSELPLRSVGVLLEEAFPFAAQVGRDPEAELHLFGALGFPGHRETLIPCGYLPVAPASALTTCTLASYCAVVNGRDLLQAYLDSEGLRPIDFVRESKGKVSESELSRWLNGKSRPGIDSAADLEDLTGIPARAWRTRKRGRGGLKSGL